MHRIKGDGVEEKSNDKDREFMYSDHILLSKEFNVNNINLNRLTIKKTIKSNDPLLCVITNDSKLLLQPLYIQKLKEEVVRTTWMPYV